jgi:formate/nitrite transporter FocA (FNT family)
MNFGIADFVIPLGVALVFLGIGRLWLLAVRRGQPLTPFMKGALLYGFVFVLGLGYLLMLGGNLNWPQTFLFSIVGLWGGIVVLLAWWRHHRRQRSLRE